MVQNVDWIHMVQERDTDKSLWTQEYEPLCSATGTVFLEQMSDHLLLKDTSMGSYWVICG
jgi:hypothetical protein